MGGESSPDSMDNALARLNEDIDETLRRAARDDQDRQIAANEQLVEHLATQVNRPTWVPKAPGVWAKGQAASSGAVPAPGAVPKAVIPVKPRMTRPGPDTLDVAPKTPPTQPKAPPLFETPLPPPRPVRIKPKPVIKKRKSKGVEEREKIRRRSKMMMRNAARIQRARAEQEQREEFVEGIQNRENPPAMYERMQPRGRPPAKAPPRTRRRG